MLELDDDYGWHEVYRRRGYSEGYVIGFLIARRSLWTDLKHCEGLVEYYAQHPDKKMTETDEDEISYYIWATTVGRSRDAARNLDGLRFIKKYESLREEAFAARILKESEFWHVLQLPK